MLEHIRSNPGTTRGHLQRQDLSSRNWKAEA